MISIPHPTPRSVRAFLVLVFAAGLLWLGHEPLASSVADALARVGEGHLRAWRLAAATRWLGAAAWLDDDHSLTLARTLQSQGRYAEALDRLEELTPATAAPAAGVDSLYRAELLDATGVSRYNLNQADRAIALHRRAANLAHHHRAPAVRARALINWARVLTLSKGRLDDARSRLEEARKLTAQPAEASLETDVLRNLGVVCWFGGDLEQALEGFFRPALGRYRQAGDLRGEAITLSNMALLLAQRGELLAFLRLQSESMALKRRIGDLAGLADSHTYLGGYYLDLGQHRKAHDHLSAARDLGRRIGYRLGENEAQNRLAKLYLRTGEPRRAIALLSALLDHEMGNPWLARHRLSALAEAYEQTGELARSRHVYRQLLALERSTDSAESGGYVLTKLASLALAMGDHEAAQDLLQEAEREGFVVWTWWQALGERLVRSELAERQGKPLEAIRLLLEAAEIESRWLDSASPDLASGSVGRVYDRLFPLLLTADRAAPAMGVPEPQAVAFRLLEQLHHRSLRNLVVRWGDRQPAGRPIAGRPVLAAEQRALARIEALSRRARTDPAADLVAALGQAYGDYEDLLLEARLSAPRYRLVERQRPAAWPSVAAALGPDAALIAYLYAADRLFALVIGRRGLDAVELPLETGELLVKQRLLRALVAATPGSDGAGSDWLPVAADLRRRLIEPIERTGALRNVAKLAIVPFGVLHDLPFGMLARHQDGRIAFLVEDYVLSYPPSATFLVRPGRPQAPAGTNLSVGRNRADRGGFPTLRRAEAEANAIGRLLDARVLTGAAATEHAFKRQVAGAEVVHLAVHGVSEPRAPLVSRLLLGSGAGDDGDLTVREILELPLAAELVTLSACSAAASHPTSGDRLAPTDRIGLTEAFLYAGAESVLASLWPVEDHASAAFFTAFYARRRTMGPARALAATQRAVIRGELHLGGDEPAASVAPWLWASFVLVGRDS